MVPPIPGLADVPFLTNETVFDNPELPRHLIVIGGGPIGLEMAQAHRRLGAQVTVVEMGQVLGKDDPELVDLLVRRLAAEGVAILARTSVTAVAATAAGVRVEIKPAAGAARQIEGSHVLVAAGRRPNTEDLALEVAGVAHDERGIIVDARLRSSNKHIYAVGDVAGELQFTHVAGYHAGIVLRNALFRLPAKVDYDAIPWVTYTDPELAHVGLDEAEARRRHGRIRILRWSFADNDRAQAERQPHGLVKAIVSARGRVLGASIVGAGAGELIQPWVLALSQRLRIGALANMVAPYPTLGEASKRAAGNYYLPLLFSPRTRRIVQFLARFG
jgi:pyruvate/2-oxoglutarate dehydrogenase complex dihydrolipoamide dehydrogenase (E3) component